MNPKRPYIPLVLRVLVAERQVTDYGIGIWSTQPSLTKRLAFFLDELSRFFGGKRLELHHRPALVNRQKRIVKGRAVYDPPANHPDYLVYLPEDEHDIETRVRGLGAARSDLGQARYNKRVARNRAGKPKRRWASRGFPKGRKLRSRRRR